MNETEYAIKNISALIPGFVKRIDNSYADGYLSRTENEFQIAIPYDGVEDFSDEFVGIYLRTGVVSFGGQEIRALYLHASNKIDIGKFVPIAEQFLSKSNRKPITTDPHGWFDEWRQIFGDTIKHQSAFDVLGELMALREVYKKDKTAKWAGPTSGSQDIVCEKQLVEVKTTTQKKVSQVYVHSAIQLVDKKPLFLYFVRLELKPFCESIDTVEQDLIKAGYSEDELEAGLSDKGLIKGSKLRKITYDLLELSSFAVDKENFPLISLEQLNKSAPKHNICDFQLLLDLVGVSHHTIYLKNI